MTIELVLAMVLTIGISALCSTLEAMLLSVTAAEIEELKERSPKKGIMLEKFKLELEETSSAILSLNTIANTLGATLVGGLAEKSFGGHANNLLIFALGMTLGILFFSEILPKKDPPGYYKILPHLNKSAKDNLRIKKGLKVEDGFVYSSDKNSQWMTKTKLKLWISANKNNLI